MVIIGMININDILNGVLMLSLAIQYAKAILKSIAMLEAKMLTQVSEVLISPIRIFKTRNTIPLVKIYFFISTLMEEEVDN